MCNINISPSRPSPSYVLRRAWCPSRRTGICTYFTISRGPRGSQANFNLSLETGNNNRWNTIARGNNSAKRRGKVELPSPQLSYASIVPSLYACTLQCRRTSFRGLWLYKTDYNCTIHLHGNRGGRIEVNIISFDWRRRK